MHIFTELQFWFSIASSDMSQYNLCPIMSCFRKVFLYYCMNCWWTDGQTNRQTGRQCHTIIHPIYRQVYNTLRPRQNGHHFPDDIFIFIFLNENVWISVKISLKFVPKGSINNIPALIQIMAWRQPGDKPLSESMLVSLLTPICVTCPQWVKKGIRRCTSPI